MLSRKAGEIRDEIQIRRLPEQTKAKANAAESRGPKSACQAISRTESMRGAENGAAHVRRRKLSMGKDIGANAPYCHCKHARRLRVEK